MLLLKSKASLGALNTCESFSCYSETCRIHLRHLVDLNTPLEEMIKVEIISEIKSKIYKRFKNYNLGGNLNEQTSHKPGKRTLWMYIYSHM